MTDKDTLPAGDGDSAEAQKPQKAQQEQEALESWVKKLDLAVIYRSEAGVFEGNSPKQAEDLLGNVKEARVAAAKGDLPEAHRLVSLGFTALHAAIRARPLGWRLVHIHAVPLWLYYFLVLVGLMLAGLWADQTLAVWGVPITIVVFGTLGGVLRGLWWVYKKVQTRTLRTQFIMVYLAGPWLGGLLGMFAWMLIKGGLLFLAGPGSTAGEGNDNPSSITATSQGMNAVAFLAGYSWEWVVGRVRELSEKEK